mmetsp:Transcript_62983/g.140250  ORF Transcript_62983/g.140250 Transcript_62983/m.140250 type:complete len:200 (+) Transcript_62983:1288-1887(+)
MELTLALRQGGGLGEHLLAPRNVHAAALLGVQVKGRQVGHVCLAARLPRVAHRHRPRLELASLRLAPLLLLQLPRAHLARNRVSHLSRQLEGLRRSDRPLLGWLDHPRAVNRGRNRARLEHAKVLLDGLGRGGRARAQGSGEIGRSRPRRLLRGDLGEAGGPLDDRFVEGARLECVRGLGRGRVFVVVVIVGSIGARGA